MYSVSDGSIQNAIKSKRRLANFYWSYEKKDQLNMEDYSTPNESQHVYKYSKEGVCVGIYDSLQQAAKENNYPNAGTLLTLINNKSLTFDHYYSYELHETFKPNKLNYKAPIYTYDLEGNFIKSYKNISELLKEIGLEYRTNIYRSIRSETPYKEIRYRLDNPETIEPYTLKTKTKKVDVFDIYGKHLKTYDSVNAVIRDLNLDSSSVNRVLKGTQKQTKGYILKPHGEIKI